MLSDLTHQNFWNQVYIYVTGIGIGTYNTVLLMYLVFFILSLFVMLVWWLLIFALVTLYVH